jgi:hypothetical protein
MTTKKSTKPKKLTKFEELQKRAVALDSALFGAYEDCDEALGLLYLIINEAESPMPNNFQLRRSLQAFRTLLIANQSNMMVYADFED